MLLYPLFFRRFGVRKKEQILAPRFRPLSEFEIPRGSVLHHLPADDAEFGPDVNDLLFARQDGQIYMNHLLAISTDLGFPRPTQIQGPMLARRYQTTHRLFKPVRDIAIALREPRNLVVENYSILSHLYRYRISFLSTYFKWRNIQNTFYDRLTEHLQWSDREQFVYVTLPQTLPSLQDLRRAENRAPNFDKMSLEPFRTREQLWLLDFWMWMGHTRENSAMSRIPEEGLSRVNIVIGESGVFTVLNLGLLNDWRKENAKLVKAKTPEGVDEQMVGRSNSEIFQKRILKFVVTLMEQRSMMAGSGGTVVEGADVETPSTATDVPPAVDAAAPAPTTPPVMQPRSTTDSLFGFKIPVVDVDPVTTAAVADDITVENRLADHDLNVDVDDISVSTDLFNDEVADEEFDFTNIPDADQVGRIVSERDRSLEAGVMRVADELADIGKLTAAEYRRIGTLATRYQTLPNPQGEGTLADLLRIDPKDISHITQTTIPDIPMVLDKSMLRSTLIDFDQDYVQKIMPKDIANAVLAVQNAGIAVTNFQVDRVSDVMNKYDAYTIQLTPVAGAPSTVRFRIPVIEEDGTFIANGVKQRLRKQRGDIPIRKVSPSRVALTSYYSKVFVSRSERAVNNYARWLISQVMANSLSETPTVTGIRLGNVFDRTKLAPHVFSTLASKYSAFEAKGYQWVFDLIRQQDQWLDLPVIAPGLYPVARGGADDWLVMDLNDTLYRQQGGKTEVVGTIEEFLGLDQERAPLEISELRLMGKNVPVGLCLAYYYGLSGLIEKLGVEVRRVPRGTRLGLAPDEFTVQFSDESLVFARSDRRASMLLGGLNVYRNELANYSVYDFDRRAVFFNVLDGAGLGQRWLRELELLQDMWVDPITLGYLEEMEEPTTFDGLLMRATELLLTDEHPDEVALSVQRIKGYERFAGAVYKEMVIGVRGYKSRPLTVRANVDIAPHAVWNAVLQDPAIILVEESNPIHNLKEKEIVTFAGNGGRSGRSMVRSTRVYTQEDIGVVSEATVDNSDVAINTYLSANPNLTSLRGGTKRFSEGTDGPSSILSTSALLAPAADRDDPKRVNFISIQQSQGISAVGYQPTPLRTGYEQVLAHRVDKLFAYAAKQDGRVVEVSPRHILVEYADGTQTAIELGTRYGIVAGMTLPHQNVTDMAEGATFKAGTVLSWNTGFFERDFLNPTQVVWKAGVMAKVAIMESADTHEDSSVISPRLGKLLATSVSKVRDIVVRFDQEVRNLISVGDPVDLESILCTLEDPVTSNSSLFDAEALDSLKLLAGQNPKAKYDGQVQRIDVLYHGDREDMSESLKLLAARSDRDRGRMAKLMRDGRALTGAVDSSFRVDGNPLESDQAVIQVYITAEVDAGVGDKGVLGNQMKTIAGKVMTGVNKTESGEDIDMFFGYQSISNRIVLSPEIAGTTNTLLRVLSKHVARVYREGLNK